MALVLGLEIDGDGAHPAAWRRAAHPPSELLGPGRVRRVAEIAERAGFTLVTLDDDLLPPAEHGPRGRIGAVERAAFIAASTSVLSVAPVVSTTYSEPFHVSSQLAALAAVTDRIGLVSTTNTTFNEPADLARRLAGLDLLSDGRAGWNVVTTDNAWTGENFRRGGFLDHADRYERAEQFLTAARAIWDGWADGAAATSTDAPAWARPGAIAPVSIRSGQFTADVTPTLPRSRQGHPVIFQAGDSSEGRDFAARNADVIFSAHGTEFDDALAFADDIRARLRAAGRPEDDLRILPGTSIVVGATAAEAEEKAAWVRREQITPATALAQAGLLRNLDLSGYDPDGPLPKDDPRPQDTSGAFGAARVADAQGIIAQWRHAADANGWSLRETVVHLGQRARGHVGTPQALADKFAHFVRHGAVDGFNVSPYLVPHGLDDIVELLVPALQERGVYRTAYTGSTLREHLGLRPVR